MPNILKKLKIINKLGLHARPAALLVQVASKFDSVIEFEANGIKVNGKSIMGVMMLAAAYGNELVVMADGEDAESAVSAIEELVNSKFDEE